ncbi:ABC transporter permease [Sphingobacterium hungaricum]
MRVTIGALTLAIIAIILSVAILNGFKGGITDKQRGFFGDVIVTKYDLNSSYENTPLALDSTEINEIKQLPNVVNLYPFATKAGIMNVNGEVEGVLLKGIDKDYDQEYLSKTLLEGDTIDFIHDEDAENKILLSSYLCNRLHLKVGDEFLMYFIQEPIRKRKFKIQGVYSTNSDELDKIYVIGSLNLIRRLNNLGPNEAGGYEIRINNFALLDSTTRLVDETLPLELTATNVIEQLPDIFNWLDMLDMNDNIIFALMVIVAVINMISALLISILERSTMIGVLKALGMANKGIKKIFLYNSLYLIGYGLVLGNGIALAIYLFQRSTRFFKLDPSIYYIEYVPMSIHWYDVVLLNGALIVIALLTMFIPSMLISRISPIKTLQFK